MTISSSPSDSASAIARPPQSTAAAVSEASIASWARFEKAMASSGPGGSCSSCATASAAKRSASAFSPWNQCRRESQRRSSPSAMPSPSSRWQASACSRASIASTIWSVR